MKLADLPWLPLPPADFSAAVRALRSASTPDWPALRRLATARLTLQQLTTLSRALPTDLNQLPPGALKLSVLSNATTDLLLPALAATAPRHDVWITAKAAPFGNYLQETVDARSGTNQWRPDAVLMVLDHRAFDFRPCPGESQAAADQVSAAVNLLLGLVMSLQQHNDCLVIVQTLVPPRGLLFGHFEWQLPGTLGWQIEEFNRLLRSKRLPGLLLLDAANLSATAGSTWHDTTLWNLGKIPFSQDVTPLYAEHVCRLLMAATGKSKKCLVLDLDNTVWGGVIGDDGLGGIVLGEGSAAGEAHLAVQAAALALHRRGVVLAVSSKNEDTIARLPFREHPDMLLRESHIAAFQANWQDKASNLRAIARILNIGVDALVLLDDNPAERQQVRLTLPDVGVPELPQDPEHFAELLLAAGYFETLQFTDEDRERGAQYQANAARSALMLESTDLAAHLRALDMEAQASPFDAVARGRITQLINKTNQFNLTTRRRNESEVAALEADASALTLQVRLKDRFGDNGIIGVLIAVAADDGDLVIDTWLMSCRVLNRRVEHAVLNVLVEAAIERGHRRLVGWYRPTPKNALVADHYASLGFIADGEWDGAFRWVLELDRHQPIESPVRMRVVDTASA
jgi:FkbH-like protein